MPSLRGCTRWIPWILAALILPGCRGGGERARATAGPFAGSRVSLCGGGEPFEGAAGLIGVDDAGAALMMTEHYDDIGWESGLGGARFTITLPAASDTEATT